MAEWKSIFIREKNVKKSGSKAVLVACPYLSKYTGWSFWHPAKLVFDTDQQGVLRLRYTDEFEFRLVQYGGFNNKIGEMKVKAEEIASLDWKCDIDEAELDPYETHKPEPLKPIENPIALEDLIDE